MGPFFMILRGLGTNFMIFLALGQETGLLLITFQSDSGIIPGPETEPD